MQHIGQDLSNHQRMKGANSNFPLLTCSCGGRLFLNVLYTSCELQLRQGKIGKYMAKTCPNTQANTHTHTDVLHDYVDYIVIKGRTLWLS